MKLADENKDPKRPYCDGQEQRNGKTGCVNGRTAVGPCLVTNYVAPLPQEYQVSLHGRLSSYTHSHTPSLAGEPSLTHTLTSSRAHTCSTCRDVGEAHRSWLTTALCMG